MPIVDLQKEQARVTKQRQVCLRQLQKNLDGLGSSEEMEPWIYALRENTAEHICLLIACLDHDAIDTDAEEKTQRLQLASELLQALHQTPQSTRQTAEVLAMFNCRARHSLELLIDKMPDSIHRLYMQLTQFGLSCKRLHYLRAKLSQAIVALAPSDAGIKLEELIDKENDLIATIEDSLLELPENLLLNRRRLTRQLQALCRNKETRADIENLFDVAAGRLRKELLELSIGAKFDQALSTSAVLADYFGPTDPLEPNDLLECGVINACAGLESYQAKIANGNLPAEIEKQEYHAILQRLDQLMPDETQQLRVTELLVNYFCTQPVDARVLLQQLTPSLREKLRVSAAFLAPQLRKALLDALTEVENQIALDQKRQALEKLINKS